MSAREKRPPSQLVQVLAGAPGAVPVLLVLLGHGGSATREALAVGVQGGYLDSLRWLIAVHLVRRSEAASGTLDFDEPGTVYALTDVGAGLIGSLVELAQAMNPTPDLPPVKPMLRRGNQWRDRGPSGAQNWTPTSKLV